MAGKKGEGRKSLKFSDIYRKIRKDVPGPTRVEEPGRGRGHSYSKRDRRGWKDRGT